MKTSPKICNAFSILIGAFLLIEGFWGLFCDVVFWILTTNTIHAVIHIVLGICGITLGLKHMARSFCIFLGLLLVVVGILRFIPVANEFVITLLNVNVAVAYLNIIVGLLSLLIVYFDKQSTGSVNTSHYRKV